MPRDLTGNYTLPAGNPVVTNTVIASTWANTTLSDLATAMTNSLDRTGTAAGMTGQFRAAAGAVGAPGISFQLEPTSGFYRNASNDIRFSVNSADVWKYVGSAGTFVVIPPLIGVYCDQVVNGGTLSGGTLVINCNNGNVEEVTLGAGSNIVNITNIALTQNTVQALTIIFIQDGSGSRLLPTLQLNGVGATIKWDNGLTPVLTTTAGKTDIIQILAVNIAGTVTLYGAQIMGNC